MGAGREVSVCRAGKEAEEKDKGEGRRLSKRLSGTTRAEGEQTAGIRSRKLAQIINSIENKTVALTLVEHAPPPPR